MNITIPPATEPTNVPSGTRRTVAVTGLTTPYPTTTAGALRAAARLLAVRGLYQGDYIPDPCDREMCIPQAMRPMSIVAAIRCAVSGHPLWTGLLSDEVIGVLALRLELNGELGPYYGDIHSLEAHVDGWGDLPGRTTESACAVLYAAADAAEVRS